MKSWWLYVLRLEESKYYIGITSKYNPNDRIKQHGFFAGAAWTNKYKPLETIELQKLGNIDIADAQTIENKITREYIKRYGIDNVRGGDIAMTSPLIIRFGRIFTIDDWSAIKVVTLLTLIIFLQGILLIIK